jgi:diadenosine tetraphosphate (Ap4A) HIT family hydrolase
MNSEMYNPHSKNIMSRNTHCQALLQWNKHNEQQLHIHVILRNLGNRPGKTPMWGNPEREREREREREILLASGKLYQ